MIRSLLWIDSIGGLTVGVLVLVLSSWLSGLYNMPLAWVIAIGAANLAYGTYSFSLARRTTRPRALLVALVIANGVWSLLCAVAAVVLANEISTFGLASLLLESVFVGTLAVLEWRHRELLLSTSPTSAQ